MCLPLIAAGVSAVGALSSASAQSQSFKNQAKISDRQAELERDKGAFESRIARERQQRVTGAQIAGFGASGVTSGGSVSDVISDTITEANLDIGAIRFGSEVDAQNFEARADLARGNARQATIGGVFGAISPFLNAASSSSNVGTQLIGAFG